MCSAPLRYYELFTVWNRKQPSISTHPVHTINANSWNWWNYCTGIFSYRPGVTRETIWHLACRCYPRNGCFIPRHWNRLEIHDGKLKPLKSIAGRRGFAVRVCVAHRELAAPGGRMVWVWVVLLSCIGWRHCGGGGSSTIAHQTNARTPITGFVSVLCKSNRAINNLHVAN